MHGLTFKINYISQYSYSFFFFSGFTYTEKVKVVVNKGGQNEWIEEQVMVDESDLEEAIISEECSESKDETNTHISTLLTHIHFGFSCFTFQIWLCLTGSLFTVHV